MKNCYFCGEDVPDQCKFCPKCGKPMAVTQDLIDRAKANNPDAQAELYERTYKTTYSRIRAKVPDEDTAMDIMQESYLNAFTHLDQLQKPETFPSWLLSIASRQVCDWYRKNGKEKENIQMSQLEYGNDDAIPDESDILEEPEYREDFLPDESLDQVETGRLLSEILDTLPENQRIILTMRYYDEMSLNEISEDLGVNLSTVKTRLKLGKKKVEEKVLELEKSGTKLYSLGPVAFLVYLLHHMELFAPDIPANTIIGLTAAGAGGTAAANVTAGATAKAAVTTAAKGISAKVIAIIAAAVVVVGGGITAAVVFSQPSETADAGSSETAQAVSVELTPEATPSETETEPEPSEQPDDAEVTEDKTEVPEETPEENTEQQESEPAESEENQEEEAPELPSYDAVYNMTEPLSFWVANVWFDGFDGQNSSVGKIYLNTNSAVEIACYISPSINEGDGNLYYIPEDGLNASLRRMFGSQYQLTDFTNTVTDDGLGEQYVSAFSTEYPNFYSNGYAVRRMGDRFFVEAGAQDAGSANNYTVVKSIDPNGDSSCTVTVEYDNITYSFSTGSSTTYSIDVRYDLIPDESAEYGWAIISLTFSDEYNVEEGMLEGYDPNYYVAHQYNFKNS